MSLLRTTNGFERKSDSKLLEKSNFINDSMSGNVNFPTPSPSLGEFTTAINAFQEAVLAAAGGDRLQVAIKKERRETLVNTLHLLGYYVLYASAGSRIKAQSSGFTLAKEPTPSVITKPVDLKVNNSNQPGELEVSIKKVQGAVAYLHQYSTDPLLKDESWMSMTCSATKCTIDGLTPGTKYFLRVGAIGTKDQVLYSDVVSKIAA